MSASVQDAALKRKYLFSFRHQFSWDQTRQTSDFVQGDKLTRCITKNVWSPILFKNGYRSQDNFDWVDWCVFDFDEHRDIAQAAKELIDFIYIIAPTKSHTPEHHRFRVAIPFERTIRDLHEYRHNMQVLIDQFGADPACKDGARFFWPSKEIYAINTEGDCMPVEEAPRRRVHEQVELLRPKNPQIPQRILKHFEQGIERGSRNSVLWCMARDLYQEGFGWEDIRQLIAKVPTRPAYKESDYDAIVRSARRSIEKDG